MTHIEGEVNPVRDLDIIHEELRLKDVEYVSGVVDKFEKTVLRAGDNKQKPEYDCLAKIRHLLVEEKRHVRFGAYVDKEVLDIRIRKAQ